MRNKIAEIIHLSVSSQLFLLKHKEAQDAINDMNEVADRIFALLAESLPTEKKGIKYKQIGDHYSPTDHEKVGFNKCRAEVLAMLEGK